MPYNIEFQTLSFCVLLIFTIAFFSKSRMKNIQNQIYGILLFQSLLGTFMDIGSVIAITHRDVAGSITEFFAKGYLCTLVVWVALMSVYTISLTDLSEVIGKKPKLARAIAVGGVATVLGICLWIAQAQLNYFCQPEVLYSYGKGTDAVYGFGLVSLLFSLVVVIAKSKKIPFIRRLSIYLYEGILVTCSLIQLYHPQILLVSAGNMLSLVIMYFTLENPDMALIGELNEAENEMVRQKHHRVEFLKHVAEQLYVPTNAVIGMNEMIIRERPGAQAEYYASLIEGAGTSLNAIASDLMDISRIGSGEIAVSPAKYLLCSMVQEVYSTLWDLIDYKKIQVRVEVDASFPRILYGDEARVKQIMINLLSNALRRIHADALLLSVAYQKLDDQNLEMIVRIDNAGEEIWKSDCYEGGDLGLILAKRYLEAVGGRLVMEQTDGIGDKGLTTMYIPQAIVDDTPIGEFEVDQGIGAPQLSQGGCVRAPKARVLIADTCEVNRFVMTKLLQQNLVQVECVQSGERLLQCMREREYQIVFLTPNLPDMEGADVIGMAQQEGIRHSAKFLALTQEAHESMYRKMGYDGCLTKPIQPRYLEVLMQKNLPKELQEI